MAETPQNGREGDGNGHETGLLVSRVNAWFVGEVLPLEAMLKRYLRHGWRNEGDIGDMCQDVFVRSIEAARKQIPHSAKPFVFSIARNLLIDRLRKDQIVSIDAVAELDAFGLATDEPAPDRSVIARQELRRLQTALANLPERWRDAVVMQKVEGLSRREVAARMGVAEITVAQHLASGIAALAELFHSDTSDLRSAP